MKDEMKTNPSCDLISRADAIEAMEARIKWFNGDAIEDRCKRDAFIQALDKITELPSIEVVHGWRTGRPTECGKYIVTLIGIGNYRFLDIMHYDKPCMPNREINGACWYRDDDEWGDVVYDDEDIIAWMPLPKPYKGGDTE